MAAHPTPPFTPAQEARVREIVAEMIGQWSAGAGGRLADFFKGALGPQDRPERLPADLERAIARRITGLDELTADVRLDTDFNMACVRRLECLKLAVATLEGERADGDIVQRAAQFHDFILGTVEDGADA